VSDRTANLKPWPKGVSGNPGGRPKKKAITEELERLLEEEAPNGDGKTWAATIAEALLKQAAKGDVRAITELASPSWNWDVVFGFPRHTHSLPAKFVSWTRIISQLEAVTQPCTALADFKVSHTRRRP